MGRNKKQKTWSCHGCKSVNWLEKSECWKCGLAWWKYPEDGAEPAKKPEPQAREESVANLYKELAAGSAWRTPMPGTRGQSVGMSSTTSVATEAADEPMSLKVTSAAAAATPSPVSALDISPAPEQGAAEEDEEAFMEVLDPVIALREQIASVKMARGALHKGDPLIQVLMDQEEELKAKLCNSKTMKVKLDSSKGVAGHDESRQSKTKAIAREAVA